MKTHLIAVLLCIFFISCKKTDCPPPAPIQGNDYGFAISTMNLFKKASGYDSLITISGFFSKNGTSTGIAASDYVGPVLFNNKPTAFDYAAYKLTVDSGNFLNQLKYASYSINGTVSFSSSIDVPFWTKANLANFDSVMLSQPLTFDVSDFTNANNGITVIITTYNQQFQFYKSAASGTLTILPSELSSNFYPGYYASVEVYAGNTEEVVVGSQRYKVYKESRYFYDSKIVN